MKYNIFDEHLKTLSKDELLEYVRQNQTFIGDLLNDHEKEKLELIECLKDVLKIQIKNFMRCDVLLIPDDNMQQIQYLLEKHTGESIEEL